MAKDVGYRLLPAFNTTTGIPYPRVSFFLVFTFFLPPSSLLPPPSLTSFPSFPPSLPCLPHFLPSLTSFPLSFLPSYIPFLYRTPSFLPLILSPRKEPNFSTSQFILIQNLVSLLLQVNLKYGIHHPSSNTGSESDTCTACGGTMIMEFGALSRLTGEPIFEVWGPQIECPKGPRVKNQVILIQNTGS